MKINTACALVVSSMWLSNAFAQSASPADAKQFITGAHFKTTSPVTNTAETWVSESDGTAWVSRDPELGHKHSDMATKGAWSLNESGQYCLRVEWGIGRGGPEDWCASVDVADGHSATLTLASGQKVAVSRD
jgi:hypothetical protein